MLGWPLQLHQVTMLIGIVATSYNSQLTSNLNIRQAFCVRSPAITKFRGVPLTDQPFRPCQEETVIDCRFAVGDILDVVASLGGCDLDVLVSGAGCDPHGDDWASDGGRTVVTSVSSDIQKSR